MDYGTAGLAETLAAAAAAGMRTFGAGPDLAAATAPLRLDLAGCRLGLLAATDNWGGMAAPHTAGVSPLGYDIIDRIRRLRAEADCVIVSVHGGGEMSPWPSPRWQAMLRTFAECGAHFVHAHHPHVPLGWERWGDGWIFHGAGNTVVNPAGWTGPAWTRRSWRFEVDVTAPDRPPRVSEWEIAAAGPAGAELHCRRTGVTPEAPEVRDLNSPLADPALLEGLHQEYALRLWESFYADRVNLGDTFGRRVRLTARTLRDAVLAAIQPARGARLRRDRGLFHRHLYASATHADEIATALGVLHGEIADRRDARSRTLAERWLPAGLFGA
jgi:hypothetical protein